MAGRQYTRIPWRLTQEEGGTLLDGQALDEAAVAALDGPLERDDRVLGGVADRAGDRRRPAEGLADNGVEQGQRVEQVAAVSTRTTRKHSQVGPVVDDGHDLGAQTILDLGVGRNVVQRASEQDASGRAARKELQVGI